MPTKTSPREIVVRCSGGRHPVRLGKGIRFWRAAKCPVCRASVDPKRTRRLFRWCWNLGRPASGSWPHKGLWWGTFGFLAFAIFTAVVLWAFGDIWWPATVLLFGPRWVLLLPLSGLVPLAVLWDRPLISTQLMAGLVILGPVMGFQMAWRSLVPGQGRAQDIQVVTLNARGGMELTRSPANLLAELGADVLAIQECSPGLRAMVGGLSLWETDSRSGVCLVSRFPIAEVFEMEREALESAGGSGVVVTYELDIEGSPVYLTSVHLETPRAGFELVRAGRLEEGIPKVREKSFLRGIELRRASSWAEKIEGAQIVLGDFNTPPESRAFRENWAGWQNTFSAAGWGFGGTRLNGWIRVRIDHILVNEGWKVVDAWVGTDVGSDHLPVVARIRLR